MFLREFANQRVFNPNQHVEYSKITSGIPSPNKPSARCEIYATANLIICRPCLLPPDQIITWIINEMAVFCNCA